MSSCGANCHFSENMSATASIAVQAASNVLLIPNQAIAGSFSNPMVRVMVNGQPEERAVRLGTTDYMWTEVVEGLQEGDVVLVEAASGTSAGLGEAIGRMMRGFGGGMIPGSGGGEIHFDRGR